MFDSKLMLIDSSTDVTTNVTGDAVDFRGEDAAQLVYRVLVPAFTAGSVTVTIQQSDDGSTNWSDLVKSDAIAKAGQVHLHARGKKRYRRATLAVSGSGNFGKMRVGVVPAGTYRDW